jgi:hypothetical protein
VPLDTAAIAARSTTGHPRTIIDLGLRAIGNQVLRGVLHDSLIDHLKTMRQQHPEVDFILIEPRPDDEKMFFHEVMSFSAQLIVLQHGYETVTGGLHEMWPYLSRILPKHGIEITRKVLDSKPLEMPVEEMESQGNMLGRLFQTVLDRRSATGERAEVTSLVDAQPAKAARPRAKAKAKVKPRTAAPRKAAAAGAAGSERPRQRGTFRPRIVDSD